MAVHRVVAARMAVPPAVAVSEVVARGAVAWEVGPTAAVEAVQEEAVEVVARGAVGWDVESTAAVEAVQEEAVEVVA